jgi:excisionase family DNA binding protein
LTEDRITVRIPEACRMIGIGRSKLYELLDTGEIETVKIGASRLVLVSSLRAFIEANRA